jgi:hypothetical protein
MAVSEKQVQAILALPPAKRYDHFVKKVVGWRKLWGLYQDGWAMSQTEKGDPVFPLWPEPEYAALCASGVWEGYVAEEIDLTDFLNELLPKLREDGVLPGAFYVTDGGSVNVSSDQLETDLKNELAKYE